MSAKDPHATTIQQGGLPPVSSALPKNRAVFTVLTGPEPGRLFALDGEELVFGRDESAVGRLLDDGLSRRHARVFRRGGETCVEDLGSTNGTFVGEERLTGPRALAEGDRVGLGRNVVLRYSLLDALEEEAQRVLYESTVRDPLTRAYNRRYFDERLQSEYSYAARHGADLTVAFIDVDHFKKINDSHGHAAGDAVLAQLARVVGRALRSEDVFARYGGEEFVVLLRGVSATRALQFGERVRSLVESLEVTCDGRRIPITASVGVATYGGGRTFAAPGALVAAADAALYQAKAHGRNRVEAG